MPLPGKPARRAPSVSTRARARAALPSLESEGAVLMSWRCWRLIHIAFAPTPGQILISRHHTTAIHMGRRHDRHPFQRQDSSSGSTWLRHKNASANSAFCHRMKTSQKMPPPDRSTYLRQGSVRSKRLSWPTNDSDTSCIRTNPRAGSRRTAPVFSPKRPPTFERGSIVHVERAARHEPREVAFRALHELRRREMHLALGRARRQIRSPSCAQPNSGRRALRAPDPL